MLCRDYEAAVVEFKSWAIIYCTLAIIPGRKYSQMSFKLKLLLDSSTQKILTQKYFEK